jgi:Zn-dependent protease
MNGEFSEKLLTLFLVLPALIAAFTIHEFAHAWAGYKLGDDTAQRQGRLSIDPFVHIDPFGFLIIIIAIVANAPLIGWAKPVPFNPRNLSNPRRDAILIAIAGPISNIIQAVFWLLALVAFRFVVQGVGTAINGEGVASGLQHYSPQIGSGMEALMSVLIMGVIINLSLAAFNMIPIPPLDGHYVLEGLGPPYIADLFDSIRPYSFFILMALIWFNVLDPILDPVQRFSTLLVGLALGMPL